MYFKRHKIIYIYNWHYMGKLQVIMDCHSDIVGDCKDDNVKQKTRIKPYAPPPFKKYN